MEEEEEKIKRAYGKNEIYYRQGTKTGGSGRETRMWWKWKKKEEEEWKWKKKGGRGKKKWKRSGSERKRWKRKKTMKEKWKRGKGGRGEEVEEKNVEPEAQPSEPESRTSTVNHEAL